MNHARLARSIAAALLVATTLVGTAHAKQYALIVGGLGGEAEYEQRFQAQAKDLATATRHASDQAQVTVFIGEQATRVAIRALLNEWAATAKSEDQLVLTLIGHGSFDGEDYRFNIPGPDVTGGDLREWLQPIAARQLIVVTTSASGAALTRLQSTSAQSERRVVITATKSGGERNATRFAEYWVQALSAAEADRDKNEWVTAQEAYDFAVRKVADGFKSNAALATEHARLEGKRADTMPLGRLGDLKEMPNDAALVALFADRVRIESEFEAVKARKAELEPDAYYGELEKSLVALAKTRRQIDARQAALTKGGSR